MKKFTFYWKTGDREVFQGKNPADAFTSAGYGLAALGAVEIVAEGDNLEYVWDKNTKSWTKALVPAI